MGFPSRFASEQVLNTKLNYKQMKKSDVYIAILSIAIFAPFFISENIFQFYEEFNKAHGMVMSFIKFAVLATLGESIGLRIKEGVYNKKGFGLLPRAIVWGVLGLTINMAFVIFAKGTPAFVEYMGMDNAVDKFNGNFSFNKLIIAFSISATMNLIYAPVMMTLHKITDMHILKNGGTLKGFFQTIQFKEHFVNLDWKTQWNFVFKKTIPFFWIPAHTITFLLPADYRVLMAALLGIALGVILSVAGKNNKK